MHRPGNWRVMRDHCAGPPCIDCWALNPAAPKSVRVPVVENCSERHANIVAASWLSYNPTVEKMP